MRSSTREAPVPAGEILVEAPTATQALEEVTSRLGPRATIVEAGKVTRGGVGGFFAREMIQLRAQPPGEEPAQAQHPAEAPAPQPARESSGHGGDGSVTTTAGDPPALDRLLADLSSQVGEQEETFATALRRHLGATTPPTTPATAPPPSQAAPPTAPPPSQAAPPPAPAAETGPAPLDDGAMGFQHALAAVRLGASATTASLARPGPPGPRQTAAHAAVGVDWSADRLLRLGVPAALLAGWRDPGEDLEGLVAFAGLVAPLCGPLPPGPALIAGPRAHRLASRLGLPSVTVAERPPGTGTVCARLSGSERARAWLDTHRGGRWLHVVTGGSGWQRLLLGYPQAVSWCGAEALPDALRVSSELGVPLGFGATGTPRGGRIVTATPAAVAIAVRDLLEVL